MRQNISTGVQFQPFTAPAMHEEFKIGDRVRPKLESTQRNWRSSKYQLIVIAVQPGKSKIYTNHKPYLAILVNGPYSEPYTVRLPAADFERVLGKGELLGKLDAIALWVKLVGKVMRC